MSSKNLLPQTLRERAWHGLLGQPRDPHDPGLSHKLSLIAVMAWIGLGVDGLSSSAYGPDESFRALGQMTYLAGFLALATAFTVFVISYAYSRLIEHFPHGGGGYVVATQILGPHVGVVSGCALLVDYVLTISVSVAGGGDAIFSLVPQEYQGMKLSVEVGAVCLLIVTNLRGLKESVAAVVPFFVLFLVTHAILIFGGLGMHFQEVPALIQSTKEGIQTGIGTVGKWGLFLVFLKAYSMGGGTYTGIEAVSNGVGALREPRVATGKRTMLYLALSLAATAGGLLLCYMLFNVRHIPGQTMNAVLVRAFAETWQLGPLPIGKWFVALTLFSESILLLLAAQTGFIDGPRVMANMALDSWLPKKFSALSDRLTIQNGIRVMGVAALAVLVFTRGHIGILVVMYSINVFITFSLTELSMIRFSVHSRKSQQLWKRNLFIHSIGFILCFSILLVMVFEKLMDGAWATMVITGVLILSCIAIRRHYRHVGQRIRSLEQKIDLEPLTMAKFVSEGLDPKKPVAVLLVGGANRLGMKSVQSVLSLFPNTFHGFMFLSVGTITSEFFREAKIDQLITETEKMLQAYVSKVRERGYPADFDYRVGTDVVWEASELCVEISKEYPHAVFFAGELVFDKPRWFERVLHNDTSIAIQRHIRLAGLPMVIVPQLVGKE